MVVGGILFIMNIYGCGKVVVFVLGFGNLMFIDLGLFKNNFVVFVCVWNLVFIG